MHIHSQNGNYYAGFGGNRLYNLETAPLNNSIISTNIEYNETLKSATNSLKSNVLTTLREYIWFPNEV